MEFDPKDEAILKLLTKLKDVNAGYPPEMLEARRQSYLKNIAGTGLGVGIGTGLKRTVKNGNGTGFPPTAGTLLEVLLVAAIVVEASTLAYIYRDKLADFFRTLSTGPKVQDITSPPVITSPLPEIEISETSISEVPTGTATELPASTPTPALTQDLNINPTGDNPTSTTPDPNGNNGNHYGQTPKPERTKDNNSDKPPNDNSGNGNNDKPPKPDKDKNR